MERPDGLIFDLDGTLWNTTESCVTGWNQALEGLGESSRVTSEDVMGIMGLPHDKIYAKLFPGHTPEQRKQIGKDCFEKELDVIRTDGGSLYPGVAEGLARLSGPFRLFLVSNCGRAYLETFWSCAGLQSHFEDWECHGNTGKGKQDNLADVIRRNKLERPAYFGDTAGDHQAAVGAGALYYHMNYGFGEPLGDCWRFDSFSEVLEFFL